MRNTDTKTNKNILIVLIAFLVIVLLYVSHFMVGILVPIFIAFFTALLLDPFIKKLEIIKIPNWLATFIVYLIFILTIGVMISIIVVSASNILNDVPKLMDNIKEQFYKIIDYILTLNFFKKMPLYKRKEIFMMIQKNTENFLSFQTMQHYIIKPFQLTLDILKGFALYAISLIFIIPGISRITSLIYKAFPGKNGKKINFLILNIKDQVQNYLIAKTIISFFVGFFTLIICIIFEINYAPLWGIMSFIFNFIPYIGAILTVIFPIMLSIIQEQPLSMLFSLMILLISVHFIIGSIIEPKFMSRGVNLRALVIYISLLIWGYIWGIAGVILAIPIMSAFNLVCENIAMLKPISILISAKEKE